MKQLLLFCSLLSIAATCNPKQTKKADLKGIDGKWTMISFVAFMPGIPSIEEGDIIWKFDEKKKSLSVLKKNPVKHENIGFQTGSYSYSKEMNKLLIDGRDYAYSFEENGYLKLDKNTNPKLSRDRPVMLFKRVE